MLIWRADRFGLAQLHQLRGRVGRGRARGLAYLLTEPDAKLGRGTRKRLETLAALDRLGAGFAISAQDLDLRGAGDLFGEEQAGHLKLIGAGLYQHLLQRALQSARGAPPPEEWSPELNLGATGSIPEEYVPEPEMRISLYARLAKLHANGAIDAFRDEVEDRFGAIPSPVDQLFLQMRLKRLCRRIGVARIDAGPEAIALTFRGDRSDDPRLARLIQKAKGALDWSGERLVYKRQTRKPAEQQRLTIRLVEKLAATLLR
jgi:transcription-repair coupling factor (superfamily II helicase)